MGVVWYMKKLSFTHEKASHTEKRTRAPTRSVERGGGVRDGAAWAERRLLKRSHDGGGGCRGCGRQAAGLGSGRGFGEGGGWVD